MNTISKTQMYALRRYIAAKVSPLEYRYQNRAVDLYMALVSYYGIIDGEVIVSDSIAEVCEKVRAGIIAQWRSTDRRLVRRRHSIADCLGRLIKVGLASRSGVYRLRVPSIDAVNQFATARPKARPKQISGTKSNRPAPSRGVPSRGMSPEEAAAHDAMMAEVIRANRGG